MNLRDEVELLLPGWESWYPSVFDAAVDLGLLRARVCSPGSLMLSERHASIYNEAVQAFREQWSVVEPEAKEHETANVNHDGQRPLHDSDSKADSSRVSYRASRFRPHRR